MDFVIKLLAGIFETFKLKSPFWASVVLLASSAAVVTAQSGELYGLFALPEWAKFAVQGVGLFLTAVTGTQTFRYLPASKQATARQ